MRSKLRNVRRSGLFYTQTQIDRAAQTRAAQGGNTMLYTIAVILLVLWLLGFVVMPVGGSLIHLLLVIALVVIVFQFLSGRRV